MEILKLGKTSKDTKLLCKLLDLPEKDIVDQELCKKIKEYQQEKNLLVDGEVGYNTWKSLLINYREKYCYSDSITDWDYTAFGKLLGCEAACLKAVQQVETGGKGGFLGNGKPQILFEGHVFWKELRAIGINPEKYQSKYPNIVYSKWDKSKYSGGLGEWTRLNTAMSINRDAAIKSASWGMFQIMGNNYVLCGCKSISEFYTKMCKNSFEQFLLGLEFIRKSGLTKYLASKDWAGFAKGYNGPGYKANHYDIQLEKAYNKFK